MKILVTGGAGFIGSALVRYLVEDVGVSVINVDKLTYSGNLDNLHSVEKNAGYMFIRADISDDDAMSNVFEKYQPDAVMHLAAETHVDRSIDSPNEFINTNVLGTLCLLRCAHTYLTTLEPQKAETFRFLSVSTDEVYGSLGVDGAFSEASPYRPNSPYAASKAGADHLVRAWHQTYGLPVITTNCSNNYGPFQFPEKLIPLICLSAMAGKPLPVYGSGDNVRDWLHVEDHARALWKVLQNGSVGETYLIGGRSELTNLDIVKRICKIMDDTLGIDNFGPRTELITFVQDRPGHDFRYAVDDEKIRTELGWHPKYELESGLIETVKWYVDNKWWWERIQNGGYRGERLGTTGS